MNTLIQIITEHAHIAHWVAFCALILAGLNIPISADVVILLCALLAATIVPENTLLLFFSVFLGCYFSAALAYAVGRLLGSKLHALRPLAKFLSPKRIDKIKLFYEKHGLLTLLIGRFIPFGVRNCIFMTTGLTKSSFLVFAIRDFFACLIWSSTYFFTFYKLGQNYEVLYGYLKTFNLLIFSSLAVAVISFVWYKKVRSASETP